MSAIFNAIGLAVRTKFEQDKESDDKKLAEIHEDFSTKTSNTLPAAYTADVTAIEVRRDEAIDKSNDAMRAFSNEISQKRVDIQTLLSNDNIINVFKELDTLLTEEGEELNKRIEKFNEELSIIAAERKAALGFDDAVVNAAMAQITGAYA